MDEADAKIFTTIVDRLTDDRFIMVLDDWCRDHCREFVESNGEYDHTHKDLHEKFCRIYESRCEAVLKENSVSNEEFAMMCRKADDPGVAIMVDIITAVGEFKLFCMMMREKRLVDC
eukprot:TRINITY_DN557_c0_g2_i1.p1 TRINITY_DN557_c0_g2~~TRINITY_DN557_c0_g2_i1.p1  ORF type:complete len:117 (+),score=49.58 TRINITY_DN557_c0_g2_i1:99-449(+)